LPLHGSGGESDNSSRQVDAKEFVQGYSTILMPSNV
jgi:hypothetical protein